MKILKILLILFSFKSYANVQSFADIVEPLVPAVVNIYPVKQVKKSYSREYSDGMDNLHEFFERFFYGDKYDDLFGSKEVVASGSGFIIDPKGYIVTNYHVVKDADNINVKLENGEEFKAQVIGTDARTDLALLKINSTKSLPYVTFGNSDVARVGDWVITMGNPFGLGGTVTKGIISNKSRDIDVVTHGLVGGFIQTDAPINSGNSGGPMFNIRGEVIGVNTAIYSPTGGNVGIGFAIPSNIAEKIVSQLKKDGKVTRGLLNIKLQEVNQEIADSLGFKEPKGALVVDVIKGGAADKSGMKTGDVILEYDGIEISGNKKLPNLVAETSVGKNVNVKVLRDGKIVDLNVKVDSDVVLLKDSKVQRYGVSFGNFTASGKQAGVVVLDYKKTSPWVGNKKLQKGDVVIGINQQPINNIEDFEKVFDESLSTARQNVLFLVKRKSETIFIALPING